MQHPILLLGVIALASLAFPARADEVFAGVYAHGVDTPFSLQTEEGGTDIQLGYRLAPIESLGFLGKPVPYVIASVNTGGDTSFAGAGLSWKIGGGPVYLRPELGIVIHDGPSRNISTTGRYLHLGSRVLLQPGLSVGAELNPKLDIEASWTHISHASLCNRRQNPGLDMWGVRLNVHL